jgi:aminodeoxyfutalosine deaminase
MDRPPLPNGRVAVQDGRVVWVGLVGEAGEPQGPVRRLGPGVLLPGLVNAHCHIELSHLRHRIDFSLGFVPWVQNLIDARRDENAQVVRLKVQDALRALETTGTVAVGDISNTLAHLDLLANSPLHAVVFYELIGWDPAQAKTVLDKALARLAQLDPELGESDVRVMMGAHAPHSVSRDLFTLMSAQGAPATIHLAESPAEMRFFMTGNGDWSDFLKRRVGPVPFQAPGISPVAYLRSIGVLRPKLIAAHCTQADDDDVADLAASGVSIAVCPRSNRNLKVGLPPVQKMVDAGINVCIGTDSLASVPTLDLMDDIGALRRAVPTLGAETLVRMATVAGASALGLDDLGTIAPGKRAQLVHASAYTAPGDPFEFLVSGEARPRPV